MRTERGVFFSSVLWICVALTVAPYCSIRGEEKRGKKISFIDAHSTDPYRSTESTTRPKFQEFIRKGNR